MKPREWKIYLKQPVNWILIISALLLAFSLKLFYSAAEVGQLRFLLSPVSGGVDLLTGIRFNFDPVAGYAAQKLPIVIDASCAGINYWIILILVFTTSMILRSTGNRILIWVCGVAITYIYTVGVNILRIVLDIRFNRLFPGITRLGDYSIHTVLSTVAYFFFLVVFFIITDRILIHISNIKDGKYAYRSSQ